MTLRYLFALLAIYLLSTGCAKQQFDKIEKARVMDEPIFGENDNGDNYHPGENDNGGDFHGGENDDTPDVYWNPREPDYEHFHGGNDHDTTLFCSDNRTIAVGYNLTSASTLELRVTDKYGNIICKNTNSDQLKNEIVNNHNLPIPNCASMTDNKYALKLLDPTKLPSALGLDLINFDTQRAFIIRKDSKSDWNFLDSFRDDHPKEILEVLYNGNKNVTDPNCDRKSSPLVIKTVAEDVGGIQLSSQRDGIWFDILGENAEPYAHAKMKISWITKDSYQFLVKPNANGKVRGIDEMFGDNTKGPDGEFAGNGYEALAKYDGNNDQVIDSRDAIYNDLKLWSDKNKDGRSQRGELTSLKDAGLVAIDLDYDDNFLERDIYGNETRMKSVVKYSDDSYRLIFDLWFNYEGKRHIRH